MIEKIEIVKDVRTENIKTLDRDAFNTFLAEAVEKFMDCPANPLSAETSAVLTLTLMAFSAQIIHDLFKED